MKKIIIVLGLVMLGAMGIFYLTTRVGEIPGLEYKYKKGETLYYDKKEKGRAWGFLPRYWRIGPGAKDRHIMELNIKDITEDGGYVIRTEEGSPAYPVMSRKGDIPIKSKDLFLGTQPRFNGGKAKSWTKTIYLPGYRKRVEIPTNFKIVRKVWGRKNTYRIKTTYEWVFVDEQGLELITYITRLKGYSDFDAERGRLIRMKSSLVTKRKGALKYTQKMEASWRLMSDEEIFKLSGLEKEWELVVLDAGDFELSKDGKRLVWHIDREPQQHNNPEIWISGADGSDVKRLPITGSYPKLSHDGSMIGYTMIPDYNAPPPLTRELRIFDLLGNDKKVGDRVNEKEHHWLPNGRLLFYEGLTVKWKTINPKTREIKEIDEDTKAKLWQDVGRQELFVIDRRLYSPAYSLPDGTYLFYDEPQGVQWKVVDTKTWEITGIDRDTANSLYQKERFWEGTRSYLWSPNRQILLIGGQFKPLKIRLLDGKEEILIPENKESNILPEIWSPDGKFFIYRFEDRKTDLTKYSLNLYSLEKKETIAQLTEWKNRPYIIVRTWSPDGRFIYFGATNNVTHDFGIYSLRLPDEVITKKAEVSQE